MHTLVDIVAAVPFIVDAALVALYPFRRLQYKLLAIGNRLFLPATGSDQSEEK